MHISADRFEKIVLDAEREVLARLPDDLRLDAGQVIVEVADRPTAEQLGSLSAPGSTLLGLYEGVPLIHRHPDSLILHPDRITLFRLPIADMCRTEVELRAQIRKTLIHELGHYFGFSEDELKQRGWA